MNVCKDDASILIIYTGGTIGMIENPETGSLEAFNFEHFIIGKTKSTNFQNEKYKK